MPVTHATDDLYTRLRFNRRGVQVISLMILVSIPLLHLWERTWIIGSLYALSIGPVDLLDPVMALQNIVLEKTVYYPMLTGLAIPVMLAFSLGKVFCSWMCPFNTLSEWIETLQKHLFSQRYRRQLRTAHFSNPRHWTYWGVFGILLVAAGLLNWPLITHLSLPGILSKQISATALGKGILLTSLLVLLVLLLESLFLRRRWCRYICPVGAGLGLFRVSKTLRVRFESAQCRCEYAGAKPCELACPLQLQPRRARLYPACFNCLRCVEACKTTGFGALSMGWRSPDSVGR